MSSVFLDLPSDWLAWFGTLGYLLLVFTPGAWITFGLALDGIPFWARLSLAVVLSPLIVCVEFYVLRLLGIPFGPTAILLIVLNVPAMYLVWKRRGQIATLHRADWLVGAAAVVIPIACMFSLLSNVEARIYSGAGWLHADAIYMLARGDLILESPTLAGFRLSYPPWGPLVFEGVHAFLVNSPPVSSYIWSNLFFLMTVYGFAMGLAKEMGGGRVAQVSCGIMLLIGTNPIGYLLTKWAPLRAHPGFWADPRYTPWVSKFSLFSPMALGLGMTMAMIYLLVRCGKLSGEILLIVCLLLCGIGLLYPLLFPPACGIIGGKALAVLAEKRSRGWTIPSKELLALAGLLLLAILLTYGEVKFLTIDRYPTSREVGLSTIPSALHKIVASLVATSLLLAGLAVTVRDLWKLRHPATILLLGGALASYVLYAVFDILYYGNEYKFVFAIAMCLAVFPAIAIERIWREWPRPKAVPVLALAGLVVVGSYVHWSYVTWPAPWLAPHQISRLAQTGRLWYDPPLNTEGFYLELNKRDAWWGICDAVHRTTPADSVLVLSNGAIYYPGLTARTLYVSPENQTYPGVNMIADALDSDVRGYGQQVLKQRRATLTQFFDATDPGAREQALQAILALRRPLAVIAEPAHANLLEWLKKNQSATELYENNGVSLWLIDETGKTSKQT